MIMKIEIDDVMLLDDDDDEALIVDESEFEITDWA
jgi:hypothetical protein